MSGSQAYRMYVRRPRESLKLVEHRIIILSTGHTAKNSFRKSGNLDERAVSITEGGILDLVVCRNT